MARKLRAVVTDHEFPDLDIEQSIMDEAGADLVSLKTRDQNEIIASARDADGIFNLYAKLDGPLLEQLEKCKVIVRHGVGVDTVDLKAATELGIYVCNVPDYGLDEVSTHALALLLTCARRTALFANLTRNGTWDMNCGRPMFRMRGHQAVGLVGFGQIPRTLTPKVKALGMKVFAFDPFVSKEDMEAAGVVKYESLAEMAQQVDYLSVHVPLTSSTRHMINREVFLAMKNTAYLINTARGPVVDEEALIDALDAGEIAGAGLDVMESEPPDPDNPLLSMDQVVITPHAAYYSEEALIDLRRKAAEQVAAVFRGEAPKYLVNRGVKPRV